MYHSVTGNLDKLIQPSYGLFVQIRLLNYLGLPKQTSSQ